MLLGPTRWVGGIGWVDEESWWVVVGGGGGGRRGVDEERGDGFRTSDRTASGSRTEDDEALARQLQRELELEDSGYVATAAAALAASLFSFPAREQEREDSGRRVRR